MTQFKKGDLVQIRTTNEKVMVIEYKINHAGGIVNKYLGTNYPNQTITDQVLCEGVIGGKFQKKYITEDNLTLIEE